MFNPNIQKKGDLKMTHQMVELALAQRKQKTLYCAGLDIHPFESYNESMKVYGFQDDSQINNQVASYYFYAKLAEMANVPFKELHCFAGLLSAIERYFFFIIDTLYHKCNVKVFKPQFGLYIQFGPAGAFLLQRIKKYIDALGDAVIILDCKPGDIFETQTGYMQGYAGNLKTRWGIDYAPFDFDIINPSPWMGRDVMVLEDPKSGKPLFGLELLGKGKGLIYVNKTSNPSGPHYQEMNVIRDERNEESWKRVIGMNVKPTLQMINACDAYFDSQKYGLEELNLSQFGLVVGATHPCDGSIRKVFPRYTGLNPGFGAQSVGEKALVPFRKVMLELIPEGKWNGQGAIFSSSRATVFPFLEKYGGSGKVENVEEDLKSAITRHRELEEEAYQLPEVIDAGIKNPFK